MLAMRRAGPTRRGSHQQSTNQAPAGSATGAQIPGDERTWATLAHLTGLLFFLPIPFAHILGPLVVWLLKRSESDFVDRHGKAAVNFQITFTIYFLLLLAGILLFGACAVLWAVMIFIAATRARSGQEPGSLVSFPIIR